MKFHQKFIQNFLSCLNDKQDQLQYCIISLAKVCLYIQWLHMNCYCSPLCKSVSSDVVKTRTQVNKMQTNISDSKTKTLLSFKMLRDQGLHHW